MTNDINILRFLTFVRNDIFPYDDTVSFCKGGLREFYLKYYFTSTHSLFFIVTRTNASFVKPA